MFVVDTMAVISDPALFGFASPAPVNDHFAQSALLPVVVALGPDRLSVDAWLGGCTAREAA